jgi:hypothetical protein
VVRKLEPHDWIGKGAKLSALMILPLCVGSRAKHAWVFEFRGVKVSLGQEIYRVDYIMRLSDVSIRVLRRPTAFANTAVAGKSYTRDCILEMPLKSISIHIPYNSKF